MEYIKELTSSEDDKVKVGILATDGTVKTELYQKACLKAGFKPVVPSYENQKRLMKIIYEGIKDKGDVDYAEFEEIEKEMKKTGCKYIILACTELSCFREMYRLSNHYVDAMEVMAKKAIRLCGKGIK